ncbi:MAG: hypothetical protein MUC87_12065 [Bacteroidia bacterium]|jgi:hypothetical protein|nr:hypothetical protein [Bacteroidia bacterium]
MLKRSWFLFLLFGLAVAVLVMLSSRTAERQYSWKNFFTADERQPWGCKIFRDYTDEIFDGEVSTVRATITDQFRKNNIPPANYIFINSQFSPTFSDVNYLCKFAEKGGSIFIAAGEFGLLEDSLKFRSAYSKQDDYDFQTTQNLTLDDLSKGDTLRGVNFLNPKLKRETDYIFDKEFDHRIIRFANPKNTTSLGRDGSGNINFIRIKWGKGEFLIHTLPRAFTNYYMADSVTASYGFRAISYLPVRKTFWDEKYKDGLKENRDTRRFLFSEPALKLSYYVLIGTGTLLLLFGGKRRQRPVPEVKPLQNSTLAFVETIGTLYYREGNTQDIINKKISYFLESVRARFYVQTTVFDEPFLQKVSGQSGVNFVQVMELFQLIDRLRHTNGNGSGELRKLEQHIWDFNQNSKR